MLNLGLSVDWLEKFKIQIIIPIKFLVEQKKIFTWIWLIQAFNGLINLINN
jgi:hypothetical protein